jgi:hypothetical protein
MPLKPSAKQTMRAQAALTDTQTKLANLRTRREAALLEGDDPAPVIALDQEIAKLERIAQVQKDRIGALEKEAEREAGLARAKRRSELIARVKAKIAEADQIGAEAQAVADRLVELFKRECQMRIGLAAMWPWTPNDSGAIGLNGVSVRERYMWYFYKIGAVMNFGGGSSFDTMTPSFPGGISPRLEDRLQPEKIPSMVDVMAEKSAYAAKVLDAGVVASEPIVAVREATPTDKRRAKLLARINEASKDVSEQGERRYEALHAELAALELEIATAPSAA